MGNCALYGSRHFRCFRCALFRYSWHVSVRHRCMFMGPIYGQQVQFGLLQLTTQVCGWKDYNCHYMAGLAYNCYCLPVSEFSDCLYVTMTVA